MPNEPIAFAAILAGGWLLDRGAKDFKSALATSGSSTATTAGGTGQGINPFKLAQGLQVGRTDQGVDASMAPGSKIVSPWSAKVTAINQDWYAGQPQVVLEITSGPLDGQFIYLAEQIIPQVAVGDAIKAGQVIATYAGTGTGIEMGLAANAAGETEARASTGYTEGEVTPAGLHFRNILRSLGVNV